MGTPHHLSSDSSFPLYFITAVEKLHNADCDANAHSALKFLISLSPKTQHTLSPTLNLKVAMLPVFIVGDSAGIASTVCGGKDDLHVVSNIRNPFLCNRKYSIDYGVS
jgi:hypothetical protein